MSLMTLMVVGAAYLCAANGPAIRQDDDNLLELSEIARLMRQAEELLAQLHAERSIERQKEIIDRLTKLIQRLKGRQPRPRPVPRVPTVEPRLNGKFAAPGAWGRLGPKERDAMLHERELAEEVPPGIRKTLEDFRNASR